MHIRSNTLCTHHTTPHTTLAHTLLSLPMKERIKHYQSTPHLFHLLCSGWQVSIPHSPPTIHTIQYIQSSTSFFSPFTRTPPSTLNSIKGIRKPKVAREKRRTSLYNPLSTQSRKTPTTTTTTTVPSPPPPLLPLLLPPQAVIILRVFFPFKNASITCYFSIAWTQVKSGKRRSY